MQKIILADLKYNLKYLLLGAGIIFGLTTVWKLLGKMPAAHSYLFAFAGASIGIGMIMIFSNYARHTPARVNIYLLPVNLTWIAWARMLTPIINILILALVEVTVIFALDTKIVTPDFLLRVFSLSLLMVSVLVFLFFLVDYNSRNRNPVFKWVTDFLSSMFIFIYCIEGSYLIVDEEARVLFDISSIRPSEMVFGEQDPVIHLVITALVLILLLVTADLWAFRRRISFRDN